MSREWTLEPLPLPPAQSAAARQLEGLQDALAAGQHQLAQAAQLQEAVDAIDAGAHLRTPDARITVPYDLHPATQRAAMLRVQGTCMVTGLGAPGLDKPYAGTLNAIRLPFAFSANQPSNTFIMDKWSLLP